MKFDKKEAAGQPLPFSAPKNPQWVMLAALLLSYAAGYEYVDRCLGFGVASEYSAWRAGVLVFVALYTVVVELAAWAGDRKPSRTAAAWWCCWLVQSLAMAGWSLHTDDLGFWQVVAWHCTAIYYVLARNDLLAAGRTSCLVLLDGVAGMFAIPFGNFLLRTQLLWQALHRWWANHAGRKGRTLETAVSITAALLLGGAACATLAGADDNFARLWGHLGSWLGQLFGQDALLANLLIFALSLPVGAWLFGLAGGSARRKAPPVAAEQFYDKLAALPRLPQLMGVLVMAVLCGVYTLFFAVQAAEFAAALGAPLPLTAPDAAAFAVNGFWEFCRILALDLTVLAALHFLGAQPVTQKGLSRVLAVALCGFGAGFAMLAAAKLAVYINLYGPTVRRIWAAWVLGALLLASVLAAVRLFCGIPAARMAFVAAAFSFSLLCCLPLERFCGCSAGPPRLRLAAFAALHLAEQRAGRVYHPTGRGKRELVGAQPLHLAIARPFCRLKAPLGLSLLHFVSQTRTCRSETPPSCAVRKTVLSLAHPTGVCIVELHSTNANFAFDDQNENRYRCACFHKRCVT